jgi:hypothetical protein
MVTKVAMKRDYSVPPALRVLGKFITVEVVRWIHVRCCK